MIGIYKFTNKITGEAYIGQSINIRRRYNSHKNKYDHDKIKYEDTYFHRMLRHYGFENFDFEIIEECSKSVLDEREQYYISLFNTLYPNGYNITSGGNSVNTNTLKNMDDVIKIRQLLKTTKMSNSEIGYLFGVSDQTISDINSGRIWFSDDINYPIRDGRRMNKKMGICAHCGKQIDANNITSLCINCFKIEKAKNIPDKNYLINLLKDNSFESVGKMFNVSGNAVKKWCVKYDIPHYASYYKMLA